MEALINVIGKNDLPISENINHLAGLRGQHSGEVAHISSHRHASSEAPGPKQPELKSKRIPRVSTQAYVIVGDAEGHRAWRRRRDHPPREDQSLALRRLDNGDALDLATKPSALFELVWDVSVSVYRRREASSHTNWIALT